MGIIDEHRYTLRCPSCGAVETAAVLDKGSAYSGSFWSWGAEFSQFHTSWQGGGKTEPALLSATCKKCKTKAISD